MTSDHDYKEWLEQAKGEWDAEEMIRLLSKESGIEPEKLKVLFGNLQNTLECGEMIEFLTETYLIPPSDAIGMYMGRNE